MGRLKTSFLFNLVQFNKDDEKFNTTDKSNNEIESAGFKKRVQTRPIRILKKKVVMMLTKVFWKKNSLRWNG